TGPADLRAHCTSDAHLFQCLHPIGVFRNLCASPLCGTSLPVGRSSMLPQLHVPPDTTPPPRSSLSRRRFVGGAAAAAGAAALAGCGGGGASTDPSTLQVWSGLPPESGPQSLIDRFQEAHPDIPVRYTRYVNDDRGNLKVNTALQGGVDIYVCFTLGIANLAMRGGTDIAADTRDRVRATPERAEPLG